MEGVIVDSNIHHLSQGLGFPKDRDFILESLGVGGITVQYPACLYSPVLVPTVIPQFSLMAQCFFDLEIRRKSCLLAALIYSHPLFHFPNPFQTLRQFSHAKKLIRPIPTIY